MSLRVISGSAGGLKLQLPKGADLRPTMDRVKAAIFSTLAAHVTEARVLDLFAGTGGLGIEALSRGAASVVFVEKDQAAVENMQRNLVHTKLTGTVIRQDVFHFIETSRLGPFDIIFADPPYAKKPEEHDPGLELAKHPALPPLLAPNGFFILERLTRTGLPPLPLWRNTLTRGYGKTEVHYLTHA